ncbi:MAG: hypothetical protein OXI50_09560, partial [Gammaproteobacteria bacterium]|nr:hypothetical protein [Gammaproteobacteria bacterium]
MRTGEIQWIPASEGVRIKRFVFMLRCNLRSYSVWSVFCHVAGQIAPRRALDPELSAGMQNGRDVGAENGRF